MVVRSTIFATDFAEISPQITLKYNTSDVVMASFLIGFHQFEFF